MIPPIMSSTMNAEAILGQKGAGKTQNPESGSSDGRQSLTARSLKRQSRTMNQVSKGGKGNAYQYSS